MASARGAESTGKHARPANGTKGNGEKRGRRRMTAEKARRGSMGRAEKQREKQITASGRRKTEEKTENGIGKGTADGTLSGDGLRAKGRTARKHGEQKEKQ
eukprot:TRINITY_DN1361_c0_g1_i15.p3 TRINITY_DN1361_c0_g1~~TRINITY_DN1361_c0_g1_i15.p3  ORF type:complete len:101 (-),score=27.00 TRINITY_DN1361_c0_g1_i15:189-491(-)